MTESIGARKDKLTIAQVCPIRAGGVDSAPGAPSAAADAAHDAAGAFTLGAGLAVVQLAAAAAAFAQVFSGARRARFGFVARFQIGIGNGAHGRPRCWVVESGHRFDDATILGLPIR
jgi:hypothetical protein